MRKVNSFIDSEKLKVSSEVMRALCHPLRLKIIEFIDGKGTINVNKIYNTLKLEQSITSQHLRILRKAGLVKTNRDGKFIHYSLDYDRIDNVNHIINGFFAEIEGEEN